MSERARCALCGGKILDHHDAEVLESSDLVHDGCREDPMGAKTEQSGLESFGGR